MPLLAACPALSSAAQDLDLERVKTQLAEPTEGPVREAVEACVRANDVQAVGLLLEVLGRTSRAGSRHLDPAHYRDIAWDGLARITDVYARKLVEAEVRSSKSAWMRQWCAELLGVYGDNDAGPVLERALRDREVGVRRAAARALGKVGFTPALKPLEALATDRDPILRANALEALAQLAPEEQRERFVRGLADKDGGVRCALLGALPARYPELVEELSGRALDDNDWRPRIQAVENLAGVRTKTAVDALIGALDDPRPVVAVRASDSLQALTGQRFTLTEVWQRWWADHRESFDFPEGPRSERTRDQQTVAYHKIQLVSDHVAFLIDKSRAMQEQLASKGTSKAEAAQAELEQVLEAQDGRLVFNVFCYHEQVRALGDRRPLESNRRTRRQALEFVEKAPAGGPKDIWQVLEQVVSDPDLDTVFLLSSGEPDIGTYVHWNRVTWHLAELNRFQKVTVHAIVYSTSSWHREQLEQIARVTGGDFQAFD